MIRGQARRGKGKGDGLGVNLVPRVIGHGAALLLVLEWLEGEVKERQTSRESKDCSRLLKISSFLPTTTPRSEGVIVS